MKEQGKNNWQHGSTSKHQMGLTTIINEKVRQPIKLGCFYYKPKKKSPSMKQKKAKSKSLPVQEKKKRRLRVPRPLGITALCQEYNRQDFQGIPSQPNPHQNQRKDKIIKIYINQYLNDTLLYYNYDLKQYKVITNQQLAYLLNITEYELMKEIVLEIGRMGIIFEQQKVEITRGAILRSLKMGLETEALTSQQVQILMASQGDKYVPFISAEVNKAIANKIAALKPNLDLLKLLLDKQSSTLGNPIQPAQNGQPGNQNGNTYVTIEVAHKLINDKHQSALTDVNILHDITANNDLQMLPEVNPNFQGGDILRGQSLSKGMPEELLDEPKSDTKTDKSLRTRGIQDIEDYEEFTA